MIAHELLADLARCGIRVEARGDRLRYAPRSAMTPELVQRLQAHKAELLVALRPVNEPTDDELDAQAIWLAALDRLVGSPDFPPALLEELRLADAQWVEAEPADDDTTVEYIDPPPACRNCRSLELWQTVGGEWHCMRCVPPVLRKRPRRIAQNKRIGG